MGRSNTDEMMRMEHLMLREQGMALMRAGHMMNTQASIINSYMSDGSVGEEQRYGLPGELCMMHGVVTFHYYFQNSNWRQK